MTRAEKNSTAPLLSSDGTLESYGPQKHLVLIDGSGFIFRAFHALPPMSRTDGLVVNAVYGFTNMILKYIRIGKHMPLGDHLAVVFDASRATFRQTLYPAYKSHRPETPADLIPQFSLIRQACHAFHIPVVEKEGFEADDLIATYAREAVEKGFHVTIVSGDKDLMQLVAPQIRLIDPLKEKVIGPEQVVEKFGVPPHQVVEVQALAGDSSDGVPGVPGIGLKTAAQLIQTYGTLQNLLDHSHEIPQTKRRELLTTYKEQALLSHQLVTLHQRAPVPLSMEDLVEQEPNLTKALHFLEEMEFRTLINRFKKFAVPLSPQEESLPSAEGYTLIQTEEDLKTWIEAASQEGLIGVDTETTSLDPLKADLVGISLALKEGKACYIPLGHKIKQDLFGSTSPLQDLKQIELQKALDLLKPLLRDPKVLKVGHNLKYDKRVLKKYGIELTPFDDTLLMSYVLQVGPHGLDDLAKRHFDHTMISYKEVTGTGRDQITFDYVPLKEACAYAAEDADMTAQLYHLFKPLLEKNQVASVYQDIERPLVPILCEMEERGILVDPTLLRSLEKDLSHRLEELEHSIYKQVGHSFNLASPKQLGHVLFEELSLPTAKKGKSGAYSTDVEVLETLSLTHPLPALILEWRQWAKLKSTYTEALLTQINPVTKRIHTSYSMAGTSTGRLASSDPNLQNIPVRTEEGRKIRSAFIAAPGYKLISADYSQIELRLLAHYAETPTLRKAFQEGTDIHALTASQVFQVPLEEVTPELRRQAKAINFGIIYGISPFGLGKQLGTPPGQASKIIEDYFLQYPGILAYMEAMKKQAQDHGYVTTLFGRRIFIPKIKDKNPTLRQAAERQAINAPLQGSNADLIKKAMIQIPLVLKEKNLQGQMLLQVHDELIFEVPEQEVSETLPIVQKIMEEVSLSLPTPLAVPLHVDVSVGKNWGDL